MGIIGEPLALLIDFFYRLYSDYYFIDNGERDKNRTTFHLAVVKAIKVLKNCQRHRTLRSCLFDFKINADLVKRKVSNKKDYTPNYANVMFDYWQAT